MKPLPPNRRVEGEEPVRESKPASAPAPRSRRKSRGKKTKTASRLRPWLQRFQLLTGIVVVVSASVLVAWGLRRYLRTSPRFAIRTIEVSGNERRGASQIVKRAGLEAGKNIFMVDEESAGRALANDPWIESAEVVRDLPNRVTITVIERSPRALAVVEGELFLADERGELFKNFAPGDPSDMPVLTGITAAELAKDREGSVLRFRRALDLLSDLEEAKITERYPVQEIHLRADARFVVMVASEGIALHFGKAPFRAKIDKLKRILGELRHRKVKPAVVFLDNESHPERVVVRMKG